MTVHGENNLFNFIRMVVPRLTRDIPRPFQMDGIIRKDDTPQHKAVREAFTNMIIHADLMLNAFFVSRSMMTALCFPIQAY